MTTHSLRQGGNRFTGYNWENNYSNAGRDWNDSSDTNMGDVTDGPAYQARRLSKEAAENNVDYKMATLQMAGYVSADKNGTVAASEVAPSSRWNKVEFQKGGALSDTPDLTDDTVYMDEYVNYLINNLGILQLLLVFRAIIWTMSRYSGMIHTPAAQGRSFQQRTDLQVGCSGKGGKGS